VKKVGKYIQYKKGQSGSALRRLSVVAICVTPILLLTNNAWSQADKPLKDLSFRFDVTAQGYVAPFVLAQKKGWYRQEGIKVTFGEGTGSTQTVAGIAAGNDDFGWADFGTMVKIQSKGAAVKAFAVVGQVNPMATVSLVKSPIRKPKDLEGLTIGANATGSTAELWPAFAKSAGVDAAKVEFVTAGSATQPALLKTGRVKAINTWMTLGPPALEKLGEQTVAIQWSDYGVNLLNTSVIARPDIVQKDSAKACGFIRAAMHGWEYSVDHAEEAVAALAEAFPNVDRKVALGQLKAQLKLLHTPATAGRPIGWIAEKDVIATQDVLKKYAGLKKVVPASDLYTNECFR
jgi:NitT/TauT family transport system substrate-binding protein